MPDKVAIVVGISGMDGESAAHFLLAKGYWVVGTYRKNTQLDLIKLAQQYGNNPLLDLRLCDICDFGSVRALVDGVCDKYGKIDEIYLLAAQSHVGDSFASAETTVITNGMSAYNFLENIRILSQNTRLYYAATSELLGGDPAQCPFTEDSIYECRSPYSIGKELGTRWIKFYNQTYGTFATYGILFNHSNCSRGESFFIRRVTKAAARIALGKQKELVLGNLDFFRDEHWSDFGVEMMWQMLQLPQPEVFLVCRGQCFEGREFLEAAFSYFNLDWMRHVKLDKTRHRPNEVVKLVGSPAKAVQKLGWRPDRMSFKSHIELMCRNDHRLECGEPAIRPKVFDLFP